MAGKKIGMQEIAIVWFKRDLRFTDNEPLYTAQKQQLPILLVYCFEPSVMSYADSDVRHWRFVYQSLQEMQSKLSDLNAQMYIFHDEVLSIFQKIAENYHIRTIFSHEEIGNKITFDRDICVQKFCLDKQINWREFQHNGIIRKDRSRENWEQLWKQNMRKSPKLVDEQHWNFLLFDDNLYQTIKGSDLDTEIKIENKNFQPGGESFAWKYI